MTSVVYDGKVLAVDSRTTMTSGVQRKHTCTSCGEHTEVVAEDAEKLHVNKDGKWKFRGEKIIAMAGAGTSTQIKKAMDVIKVDIDLEVAYKNYLMLSSSGELNITLMIVTEKQVYEIDSQAKSLDVKVHSRDAKVFIGSGAKSAHLAVALLGVGAVEAINLTMHVDKATGGKIHSVDCTSADLQVETTTPKKPITAVMEWEERNKPALKPSVLKGSRVVKKA